MPLPGRHQGRQVHDPGSHLLAAPTGSGTRLVSVVVDAHDIEALGHFWAGALQWTYSDQCLDEREVNVVATDGSGLELTFVPADGPKTTKNRIHLDLAALPGDDGQQRLVDALLEAGATHADIGQGGDLPWIVLADPEGNEFCVLAPEDGVPDDRRLVSISLDADDPRAAVRFWAAATGWAIEEEADDFSALRSPTGTPSIGLGPKVAPKAGKNRVHLDVAPFAEGDVAVEVERLVALGATHVDIGQGDDVPWVVLAGPDGNEFCVLTPR